MSLINEYRATEEAIKELQERLKSLEQDDKLKKELEFEEKLRTLMGTYQKSLRDVISCSIRTPRSARAPAPPRRLPASARARSSSTRTRTPAKSSRPRAATTRL